MIGRSIVKWLLSSSHDLVKDISLVNNRYHCVQINNLSPIEKSKPHWIVLLLVGTTQARHLQCQDQLLMLGGSLLVLSLISVAHVGQLS